MFSTNEEFQPPMSFMQGPFRITYSPHDFCAVPSRINIETAAILYPNLKKLRAEHLCDRCLPWLDNKVDDESVHSNVAQICLYGEYVCIHLHQGS